MTMCRMSSRWPGRATFSSCAAPKRLRRGLIDANVLEALGQEGILVNIARGSIVDEPALIAALYAGTIRAAALDVFVGEPNVAEELRRSDRVVMAAHIGTQTEDVRRKRKELMLDNLLAFFAGKSVISPV